MISLLHLSDIHMGSGFVHGRLNPETGLNTRLEDFVAALTRCIDRALAESVDLVLFGGDAFPDATPPPLVQQALASQFCRLSAAGIPVVLLVGNHDQHAQGLGGASLSIYRTLGVPDVVVGDRLETHRIDTRSGPVQVVTLPWLTKSTLLTRPETEGLSMTQVNELLLERLRVALEGEIRRLDPEIPAILLAHAMVDTASYGAERFLATGRGFTIPMAMLARPCFDYVALGHVHRYQVLCEHPLMIYPGSIERVDFSEETEAKGYLLVQVAKGQAQAEFCPLPVRPFKTIEVDLTKAEIPQARLEKAIAKADIADAVVRCLYTLRSDQVDRIDQSSLETALAAAHTYSLQPELKAQTSRSRLPELGTDSTLDPLTALSAYLTNRNDLGDIAEGMLAAAAALMADDTDVELPLDDIDLSLDGIESLALEETAQQLRLL
ncbi:exonuclease subunit SbcD [Nodosilinea sp. LEGE 07298]|uniref:exonuclease subunit SbcD n=1 Tax=Nodosilinea sp. LEGE 07298 TaxID=2777970 RepID=UPI001880E02E|nr:exonuclease subunit SbcD [Nodosilinea sp. LEGE 07298]MBE9110181.1 exonuclease subunit SbcD [Nodosilinea sp. LEGE 07298]